MTSEITFTPLPDGTAICTVSPLVNATLTIPEAFVITPHSSPTAAYRVPSFVFLITHKPSGKKLLYDLGVRHDWETSFSEAVKTMAKDPWDPATVGEVSDMLKEGGTDPESIHAIFFSHDHWDHTGLISPFPKAELVAGPGTFYGIPGSGFTGDLKTQIAEAGRSTRTIDFDAEQASLVGAFSKGLDYFGDGSVIIIQSAGHTTGHISALIRTTPSPTPTYILLAGDTAHHPSLFCPCKHHQHILNTTFRRPTDPPTSPPRVMHVDPPLAWDTVLRTRRMEQEENVMVVAAHDFLHWRAWRQDKAVMFPGEGLTEWKKRGLKVDRKYDPSIYEQQ